MARVEMTNIAKKLKNYSRKWLADHGFVVAPPDPVIVEAVGISVKARDPMLRPLAASVQTAMSHAVLDAYADNKKEPEFVKARMQEARLKCYKSFGFKPVE
jgi:hypothetical protein